MPPGRRLFPMYTRVELERWYRQVRCPTCDALPGAMCRNLRSPHTIALSHKARQNDRVRISMAFDSLPQPFSFDNLVREVVMRNATVTITPLDEESPKMEREEVIRQRIRELEDELARRTRYGRDVYDDGTVLAWIKTYPSTADDVYRFAAAKSDGRWYVTGNTVKALDWEGLTDYWLTADVVEVVQVMRVGSVIGAPAPQTDLEKSVAASTPPPAKEAGE